MWQGDKESSSTPAAAGDVEEANGDALRNW